MTTNITNENFNELIENTEIAVLDFWAEWCGPCRMVGPTIDKLSENNSDILIGKVNIDREPELARKFGIRSIPTVIYFKNGKITEKMVGANPLQRYQETLNNQKGV